MDLIQFYNYDDDQTLPIPLKSKSSAPKVDETTSINPLDPTQHLVSHNPTYDQLWAHNYGPAHPYAKGGFAHGLPNHTLCSIESVHFDQQQFHSYGYAVDPSTSHSNKIPQSKQKRRRLEHKKGADDHIDNAESPSSGEKVELTDEQRKYADEHSKKKLAKTMDKGEKKGELFDDNTTFHGKYEKDYQGRSWITPPKDKRSDVEHCYIPKRCEHVWSGHNKGVSSIRFFPKSGHLLLSSSMDSTVQIWDVYNTRECMRTYMGHSEAVRDICFSNDGTRFLSAGFDKNVKYWDTETGKVISSFSTSKVPYVVRLNPDDDKQNVLLAGMSDKVVQWDMNSGSITQKYDQHLGAVNTITFIDDNRRFVTSSDDKSLRVWEFGIPVVIKYISEPHMHSMPSIAVHPNSNWFAAQSLDNQILVYSTRERFQLNKQKRFAGHIAAGYACQVNFSPDGRFVMSGDGEGKMWF